MIDTVHFKVHDLKLHQDLTKFLRGEITQTGMSIRLATDAGTVMTTEQQLHHRKYLHLFEVGKTVEVAHFNKLHSHHYTIAYQIDTVGDFISFNVSVPKYVFGTNVLHYNTAPTSRDFLVHEHGQLETNLREAHGRLVRFLKKFFEQEFGQLKVVYAFVQICRLDLCYNQVFDSAADAQDYFTQLRKIRKKYSRDTSPGVDWKTTIMYKTDRYSFKVYMKGPEFRRHDAKALRDLNEKHGYRYDVDAYQAFADRMLRYEMTFRNGYMSYLYMSKIFRKDCHIWQYGLDLWKQAKRKRANPEPGPEARKRGATSYWEWRKALTADEKKHIDYVEGFYLKTKNFYLSDTSNSGKRVLFDRDFDVGTHEDLFELWPEREQRFYIPARFSKRLFMLMARKFLSILKEFQLELKEDATTILRKAEAHNQRVDSARAELLAMEIPKSDPLHKQVGTKISLSKIRHLSNLLAGSTFEEIRASNLFSRQTWYNYRQQLAQLGTTEQALSGVAVRTAMDLKAYNAHLLFNYRKLGVRFF